MPGPPARPDGADLVVVGAGVVGAACAYFAALAGLRVVVVERGTVAGGTSGAGEGNLLVSDKEPGPELELALHSLRVWREELARHAGLWEYEPKGGLVVAATGAGLAALGALAGRQEERGVRVREVPRGRLREVELEP